MNKKRVFKICILSCVILTEAVNGCFIDIFSCAVSEERDEGGRGAKFFIRPTPSPLFPTVMRRGEHGFDQTYEVIDLSKDLRDQVVALIQQKISFVLQDPQMRAWYQKNVPAYAIQDPSREQMRKWADFLFKNKGDEICNLPQGNLKQSLCAMSHEEKMELIQRALYSTLTGDDA